MAFKTVSLPLLTAGAVVAAISAYAFTRKGARSEQEAQAPADPEDLGKSSGFFSHGRVEAELASDDELGAPSAWINRSYMSEGDAIAIMEALRAPPTPTPVGDAPLHASVPDRGRVPGDKRHDVSSLFGEHALAPDADAVGEELIDPGAIEVPLGLSADEAYDWQLSKAKLPQPESTGTALRQPAETRSKSFEFDGPVEVSDLDIDFDDLEDLEDRPTPTTALPMQRVVGVQEAYDAVIPEEIGTEWLLRATETDALVTVTESADEITEIPTPENYAVSEASTRAAQSSDAVAHSLEDDDIWRALEDLSEDLAEKHS